MDQSAQLYPDRYAFEVKNDKGEHYFITYKDYRNEINALGTALFDMGFKGGAHIAVSGENCYEWCLSYLATVLGSNVIVPIDKELSADDIYGIIEKAEVKLLFCDNKLLKKLDRERIKDVIIVNFRQKEDADGVLSLEKLVS